MSALSSIPHSQERPTTGKHRWNRLVELERITGEMRALVLQATTNPRATLPEFYDWAHDLRRGRTNILGGFLRLVETMERRGMGLAGRQIAEGLLALAYEYMDAMLPDSPTPPTPAAAPIPMHEPLRLWKPVRAEHARVIRRAA